MAVALSIAGSDSGGGAGIQADIRTLHRLGVFATTAITATTAQNLDGVKNVEPTSAEGLAAQLDAVLGGFEISVIKTGVLWSAELIDVVLDRLAGNEIPLVVDPVMVSTSGAKLLSDGGVEAYRRLISRATVVTPNLDEAAAFLGRTIDTTSLFDEAAKLRDHLGVPVLLKGGHLDGPPVDLLAGESVGGWRHARVADVNTHGSGCILSSAIAAGLATVSPSPRQLKKTCATALAFVHDALARGAERGGLRLADIESATADPTHLRAVSRRPNPPKRR